MDDGAGGCVPPGHGAVQLAREPTQRAACAAAHAAGRGARMADCTADGGFRGPRARRAAAAASAAPGSSAVHSLDQAARSSRDHLARRACQHGGARAHDWLQRGCQHLCVARQRSPHGCSLCRRNLNRLHALDGLQCARVCHHVHAGGEQYVKGILVLSLPALTRYPFRFLQSGSFGARVPFAATRRASCWAARRATRLASASALLGPVRT